MLYVDDTALTVGYEEQPQVTINEFDSLGICEFEKLVLKRVVILFSKERFNILNMKKENEK